MNNRPLDAELAAEDRRLVIEKGGYRPLLPGSKLPPAYRPLPAQSADQPDVDKAGKPFGRHPTSATGPAASPPRKP
jgi:hypothetical protein